MADPNLVATDEMPITQGSVDIRVTDEESQKPDGTGGDSEIHSGNPAIINFKLVEEIRNLQQRLLEIEKEFRPELIGKALKTDWERAREELGPEEEVKRWKEEERRRKADLMAANFTQPARGVSLDDKFAHAMELFKIRRKWERQHDMDLTEDDSELDSENELDDALVQRQFMKRCMEMEMEYTNRRQDMYIMAKEKRFHMKQLQRNRRAYEEKKNAIANDGNIVRDDTNSETALGIVERAVIPDARPELLRVPWAKFEILRNLSEGQSAAIDVLIGEPVVEFRDRSYYFLKLTHSRKTKASQVQEQGPTPELDITPGEGAMPERLRINSRHLLQFLSNINRYHHFTPGTSIILLRPFRELYYYRDAIREQYRKLVDHFVEEPLSGDVSNDATEVDNVAEEKKLINSGVSEEGEEEKEETNITKPTVTYDHVKKLMDFIDNDMQKRISCLENGKHQKVFFSDLWYLFQPGHLVISNDGKQAYRILTVNSVGHRVIDPLSKWYGRLRSEDEEEASITIKCVYIDFDGKQLGPVSKVFQISKFEREKAVTSLDIYPFRFHPSQINNTANDTSEPGNRIKRSFINRGKLFLKVAAVRLAAIQPMYYAGPALQTQDEIESQVVVDFEAAFGIEEGLKPKLETLIGLENSDSKEFKAKKCDADCCTSEVVYDDSYIETKRNEESMSLLLPKRVDEMPSVAVIPRPLDMKEPQEGLSEDDLAIMTYRVFGFVLRNRKWAQLDLTYLSDVQPSGMKRGSDKLESKTAFDQLVLPDTHKGMILSLVTQHFRDKESSHNGEADIVRGKGKGLIILLHGAPGVGKTTTAEGVAENFKKPLFQLTCGDLGTTAKEVESALEMNFSLASRWGCILLLDEADVFLAQRTKEDFQRNGLVAVFLRVLEYYAGILFLTTNRVGDFDEAFASRIHMSLYYPELGSKETIEVFKLNLQLIQSQFQAKRRKIVVDEMEIGVFAEKYWKDNPFDHWNGRQIRNACQTALALAEYDTSDPHADVHLNETQFKIVAKAYLAFSQHLKDIYGTHAAQRAKEAGLRAMWMVNEKGEIVGNIGPKEARALRSRYRPRSQAHLQPQLQHQPQIQQQYPQLYPQPTYPPQNQPHIQPYQPPYPPPSYPPQNQLQVQPHAQPYQAYHTQSQPQSQAAFSSGEASIFPGEHSNPLIPQHQYHEASTHQQRT
ncbi:hypothetical protein F4805DRAFT_459782 [Annulohypoxylon moriforme]|nr:hypothetical protein F4805DRAFT_459782 [Annulohypoxylon moriforme]